MMTCTDLRTDDIAINIHNFGAVGDGQTDDTQSILNAIYEAACISGQVIFPPGVYACSTLCMKPHVTLLGCATWTYWYHKGSIIKLIDENTSCLIDATQARCAVIDRLILESLSANHNHASRGIHGIMLQNDFFLEGDEPCNRFTITGNLIRRSGVSWQDLGEYANSHIFMDGCCGITCTGNTMSIGRDDLAQGEFSPAYGIVYRDC